jgi:uncharacterized membrane protein YfcA
MHWWLYLLLVGAGFISGFVNTLAGSGSAVTLPLLIFMGLPASVANGTNRVAVVLQNVAAVEAFARNRVLDSRGALILGIPAVLGSLVGAQASLRLNDELMRITIGVVMLAVLVVILLRPQRWLHGTLERLSGRPTMPQLLLFFLIGVYGGFIQVGVGIWLLAALVLGIGYDLVLANAVKVTIVLCFTASALAVFVLNGQVQWREGMIMALGSVLGASAGARLTLARGAVWVRRVLIVIVALSAVQLLDLSRIVNSLRGGH